MIYVLYLASVIICAYSHASETSPVGVLEMSINEAVVKSTTKYKYLRSIIQRDGKIDGNVNHRIHAG